MTLISGSATSPEEAEIAEKCDIAIISCKGQSVVAARHFVDEVCHHAGVPLFVVHDFDPAGLSICQRLTSVSDYARENGLVKYEFQNDINVTDFGLRLEDVEEYELESEEFDYKGLPKDTIATDEEKEFFEQGQRVELNAFPAPDFIQWIETKLEDQLDKFVPADDILESAWRRALAVAKINRAIKDTRDQAIKEAEKAKLPKKLRQKLAESQDPWDAALYELAQETVEEEQ
jgi:Topoisomerase 6 subunit A/Spo11, Toprim domain